MEAEAPELRGPITAGAREHPARDEYGLLLLSCGRGLLLDTVKRAALLAAVDAEAVERSTNHVVANAGQIAHTTSANKHDRVLLEIVPLATDVRRDFAPVREAHTGNFAERLVRLLRRDGLDLQAHATPLRTCGKVGYLALSRGITAGFANELIDCRHFDRPDVGSATIPNPLHKGNPRARSLTGDPASVDSLPLPSRAN